MNDNEKRLRIAELQKGLENIKGLIPEKQYEQHEVEVNRKIKELKAIKE
jgi:hypothetical protein